jgi:protease secretion system outer membrane protein
MSVALRSFKRLTAFLSVAGLGFLLATSATAQTQRQVYEISKADKDRISAVNGILLQAFEQAKIYDPQYQAAQADFQSARIQATGNLFALAPSVRYSESVLEFESRSRKTLTITQPLFSIEKIGTFREADSRASQAMANLKIKEYELATRLVKATADYVKVNEILRTNQARIETLQTEAGRAKKEFELGQGTITDMRDTQVRLDQARATQLSLVAKLQTASRTLQSITGSLPKENQWVLTKKPKTFKLGGLEDALARAYASNYQLMNAYSGLRIAELEQFKARGAFAPEVNYQISKSQRGEISNDSTGITISFPLQAGGFFKVLSSSSGVEKAKATVRQVEQQVEVDVEKFRTLTEAGLNESNMRLQAISSAELSVLANEKSFAGGVRTRIDVLNSIQTQYQVIEDYVNSLMILSDNVLGLGTQTALPVDEIMAGLNNLLFE